MTAKVMPIDAERERFVNEMARYVKTHADWKNLQPEAAVRAAMWVLVSDVTAFDDLCSVWRTAEGDDRDQTAEALGASIVETVGEAEARGAIPHPPAEDRVVDLMAALEQSIADAKAARDRKHAGNSEASR